MTSLEISGYSELKSLNCSNNKLTRLNMWSSISSLELFNCENNNISCEIPAEYAQLWYQNWKNFNWGYWKYDIRYEYDGFYYDGEDGKTHFRGVVRDKGVGWWYPGEPGRCGHSANESYIYDGI